jgi:hypothetical protein
MAASVGFARRSNFGSKATFAVMRSAHRARYERLRSFVPHSRIPRRPRVALGCSGHCDCWQPRLRFVSFVDVSDFAGSCATG